MLAWVKKNKLASVLVLIILYLLFKNYLVQPFLGTRLAKLEVSPESGPTFNLAPEGSLYGKSAEFSPPVPSSYELPPSESKERLVVQDTTLSLVVKTVRQTVDNLTREAEKIGGFMVSSSLSQPEEAPYATVAVRVPADKLQVMLEYLRGISVKVSSEYISGVDVTDQYEDIEAKLATYEGTKLKFEEILSKAEKIQDILQVNREIINIQAQIDSLKGRQKYLEQTAKLAKITAYLSTDEWALPYAPAKPFRPQVIFKQAVRSLVLTLRGLVTKIIWIAVYSVIWAPILIAFILLHRWRKRKVNLPLSPSK